MIATGALLVLLAAAGAQDTAGVGVIRGVVAHSDGTPARDVAVCVAATGLCDVSRADGRFTISGVRAGTYRLEIVAPGRPAFDSQDLAVRAGIESAVEIVVPDVTTVEQTVTVTAPSAALPAEIRNSGFAIPARDIIADAGALQDVARYVQALPGVAIGTDDFRNDLIVRGGSPLENLYIVDNVEIPNINSFATFASAGGTVSMLDAYLVQDVTFLTGGYPAIYGDRTSSVLQVTQREGSRAKTGGIATIGFAGAGGVLEGPIGSRRAGSWIVSLRRSFLDLFTSDVGIGGVPVQYTFNGKAVYDVSSRDRLWFVNVTGVDHVRLGLTEDSDPTSELSNVDIQYRGRRTAFGANWQRLLGSRGVGLLGFTYSRASVDEHVSDLLRNGVPPPGTPVDEQLAGGVEVFREDSAEAEATVKYDVTLDVPPIGKVQAGGSLKRQAASYDAASPYGNDSAYFPVPDTNAFVLNGRIAAWQPGGYVQATRALGARANATVGLRADRYGYLDRTGVSPRAGIDVAIARHVSLRGSCGRYVQQPFVLGLAAYPSNRSLEPFRADHYVAGMVVQPGPSTRFTVEAYRKNYSRYPVSSQIPSLSLANVGDTFQVRDALFPMVSVGTGQAHGVELFAERKGDGGRWYGQANLAFSRVRYSGLDGVARAGSFDYPRVANVTGAYRLSPQWELSMRAAYLSGRPYTPFDLVASTAQRRGVYDLSRVNDERVPAYFRLDLRLDRRLLVGGRPMTVFGGVQNATNRRNVAGYSWDRRQQAVRLDEQLGIFPILGLEWRF